MSLGEWSLVIVAVSALLLIFLGFKYPRGKRDWPHDRERTFRYVISGIIFIVIMGLIFWITRYWDYPVSGKAVVYVAAFALPVLFILGLIWPRGRRAG